MSDNFLFFSLGQIIKKLIFYPYNPLCNAQFYLFTQEKGNILSDKIIDFSVDYSKLKIFDEFNTKDIKFPMVLSVPHKGSVFPEEFLAHTKYSPEELRCNEDSFVDELVVPASNAGIPMVAMNISRVFVDVNRDKIELDPTMLSVWALFIESPLKTITYMMDSSTMMKFKSASKMSMMFITKSSNNSLIKL